MLKVLVSYGDFLDRWTILRVKLKKLGASQASNVSKELKDYERVLNRDAQSFASVQSLAETLFACNEEIWDRMSDLYAASNNATSELAELTLLITQLNQRRAFIKRSIDVKMMSSFHEEKSYFSNVSEVIGDYKGQDQHSI